MDTYCLIYESCMYSSLMTFDIYESMTREFVNLYMTIYMTYMNFYITYDI